jgi:sugar phosphate isomerase/epimerase
MQEGPSTFSRRTFLTSTSAGLAGAALHAQAAQRRGIKLGFDNFSVRAMRLKAPALIDYAASLDLDSLFISDLDAFDSLEDAHLRELRARAGARHLQIHVGTWSVCPTSKAFRPNRGTAEEHLALGIRVARALGSPVIRVVLGTMEDRLGDGGIERHMESLARVCRASRSQALDAGVKIAIENHAGDMHSTELARLVEMTGTDYVGVNLDSGNACWTLEDPIDNLTNLAKYVVTTSLRDSAVWDSEKGARVQWTAMGEGDVDLRAYMDRFAQLCPGVAVHIETISGGSREFAFLTPEFWKAWPRLEASAFARFLALARRGKARQPVQLPAGDARAKAEQDHQRGEIERSLTYCKQTLGLGLR